LSLSQRRNEGISRGLPNNLRAWLQEQFAPPTRELDSYLQRELGISLPREWQELLRIADAQQANGSSLFDGIFNAQPTGPVAPPDWLAFGRFQKARVQLACSVRVCHEDYYGYLIAFHKGEYLAISRDLGSVPLDLMPSARKLRLQKKGLLYRSFVLEGVKAAVVARRLADSQRAQRLPRAFPAWLMRSCIQPLQRLVAGGTGSGAMHG